MFTVLAKVNQCAREGWSPFLEWPPGNYNPFYCIRIWLPKIHTAQEFGSQISLVKEVIKVDQLGDDNISAIISN